MSFVSSAMAVSVAFTKNFSRGLKTNSRTPRQNKSPDLTCIKREKVVPDAVPKGRRAAKYGPVVRDSSFAPNICSSCEWPAKPFVKLSQSNDFVKNRK